MWIFTNPYIIAIGIPSILLVAGAVAKKLVRGSNWQISDFFLGVELTLAAMSSALVHIFDLANPPVGTIIDARKMTATGCFLAICFFLMLVVVAIHQDWENRKNNQRGQIISLLIIANFVGVALLFAFILAIKGVR